MFEVAIHDRRLANKAEVLGLRPADETADAVAITHTFLVARPLFETTVGAKQLLILTDEAGAHRVYDAGPGQWKQWDRREAIADRNGARWQVGEEELRSETGIRLERHPSHSAFWFGWVNAFPQDSPHPISAACHVNKGGD